MKPNMGQSGQHPLAEQDRPGYPSSGQAPLPPAPPKPPRPAVSGATGPRPTPRMRVAYSWINKIDNTHTHSTPRVKAVTSVEELALPRCPPGYNRVALDESTMLEVVANIEDDVFAAEKRERRSASASGTDVGHSRKQQVLVSNPGEPIITPEPLATAAPFVPPRPPPTAVTPGNS